MNEKGHGVGKVVLMLSDRDMEQNESVEEQIYHVVCFLSYVRTEDRVTPLR